MSQTTKYALVESLKQLLLTKPLNKITISDITDGCGVNRMTFYYHFRDIYDMIDWALDEDVARIMSNRQTSADWQEALEEAMKLVRENKLMAMNVYRSIGLERVENYINRVFREVISCRVEEQARKTSVSAEDCKFISDFYVHAVSGIAIDWIANGMKDDPGELARRLVTLMQGDLDRALNNFSSDMHSEQRND